MDTVIAATTSYAGYEIVAVAAFILIIAGWWRIFTKAGHPGWGVLIPVYNIYLTCKTARKPGWWVILLLIPIVNIVMAFIVFIAIAKAFGKVGAFGVGMVLFPIIFVPVLGFGGATYQDAPTG
jgi:hypothetical protein